MELLRSSAFDELDAVPDVSIVMPCLNEAQSLPHCIDNARAALDEIQRRYDLSGEIVIADNGSTDGSQQLGLSRGARVVPVSRKGYGAAILGGFQAARGRLLVMGDADGSYDFTDSVAMVGRLLDGVDLCMGSRFKGGIAPGAMPWKNRYIGNPALTGILNLFFRCGVGDAHCGLRAIRKEALERLKLTGTGMEFASEMVIKAALLQQSISEVPATLSPDLRHRAPHLRPWRDGWRHLRYLFMLSPLWVFAAPAAVALTIAVLILVTATLHASGLTGAIPFGESWIVIGALLATVGHMAGIMAVASHLYGVREGYRLPYRRLIPLRRWLSLETCVIGGLGLITVGIVGMLGVGTLWVHEGFAALASILPVALAGTAGAIGLQTLLGGFLLAVIGGNEAEFLRDTGQTEPCALEASGQCTA